MTRKKRLKQKKHLYRDTQELARYVIHDPKRRRARFICQVNECARVNEFSRDVVMDSVQYLCAIDKVVRSAWNWVATCERLLKTKRHKTESCDKHE